MPLAEETVSSAVPPVTTAESTAESAAVQPSQLAVWRGLFHEFEPGTTNPSVDSLNHILMSMDFYRDIREESSSQKGLKAGEVFQGAKADAQKRIQGSFSSYQELLRKAIQIRKAEGLYNPAKMNDKFLDRRSNDDVERYRLDFLPPQFANERDYWCKMLPLFVLEQIANVQRSKKEEMVKEFHPHRLRVLSVLNKTQYEVNCGRIFRFARPNSTLASYSVGDLVLIYLNDDGEMDDGEASSPTPNDDDDPRPYHLIGVVDSQAGDYIDIQVFLRGRMRYKKEGPKSDFRYHCDDKFDDDYQRRLQRAANRAHHEAIGTTEIDADPVSIVSRRTISEQFLRLVPDWCHREGKRQIKEVHCCKIMSLVTMHREFQAAISLPNINLKDFLLLKSFKKKSKRGRGAAAIEVEGPVQNLIPPPKLMGLMANDYNESQQRALKACLKHEGITLIQGPPGTGKTTTIVGIISLILSSTPPKMRAPDRMTLESTEEGAPPAKKVKGGPMIEGKFVKTADDFKSKTISPWLYPDYKPWYDNCSWGIDECEDATAYQAAHRVDAVEIFKHKADPFEDDKPKRILVCAPSNAAIDEIVKRLVRAPERGGGIMDPNGERFTPTLVRIGPNSHPDLEQYGLQAKIKARMQSKTGAEMENLRNEILTDVSIVCATLSMCGNKDMVSFSEGFDTVVLDEASQGVELSTLIPMKLQCKRLIMVGDPKQLSATVFSALASHLKYDQSLFQRLERAEKLEIHMLSEQYRMHPAIAAFPSRAFYDKKLMNAGPILKICVPPATRKKCELSGQVVPSKGVHHCWFECHGPILKPLMFLSVRGEEARENNSLKNEKEIAVVLEIIELFQWLLAGDPNQKGGAWTDRIAVITPYVAQVNEVKRRINLMLNISGGRRACPIDVNTVDGFQGREKDIIIFSSVRSQLPDENETHQTFVEEGSIGFLDDVRRMNVACTRARHNLYVVGNREHLSNAQSESKVWSRFIDYASSVNSVVDLNDQANPDNGLFDYLGRRWDRKPQEKAFFEGFREVEPIGDEAEAVGDKPGLFDW